MKLIKITNNPVSADENIEKVSVNVNTRTLFNYYGEDIYDKLIWFTVRFKDLINFDTIKQLTDTYGFEENLLKDIYTFLQDDNIQLVDDLSFDMQFYSDDDVFTISDAIAFVFLKHFLDSFTFQEYVYFLAEKQLDNSFSFSETKQFSMIKSLFDTASFLETFYVNFTKQSTDTVTFSEQGKVQNQDCFDPLYGNEGYVGSFSSF